METTLYSIFKSIEESVEQIKGSGLTDTNSTNNLIQQAQNLLANIKEAASEKEAGNNSRKRKRADNSPNDEDEPEKKKAKMDLPLIPCRYRGAYGIFLQEKREELLAENPSLSMPQLTSVRKNLWQSMSKEDKKEYDQKAKQDRDRYDREVAEFIAKGGKMRPKPSFDRISDSDLDSESDQEDEDNPNKVRLHIKRRITRDLNAPKRPMTAYMLFAAEGRSDFKPDVPIAQRIKMLGERWKSMSDEEKQPYVQRAALDRERYDREMREYKARMNAPEDQEEKKTKTKGTRGRKTVEESEEGDDSESESGSDSEENESSSSDEESSVDNDNIPRLSNAQQRRDPNQPKRPWSPYLFFCKEVRPTLPAETPFGSEARLLSARWRDMTAEQKQPYEQQAALDKERYEREMREYQERVNAASAD